MTAVHFYSPVSLTDSLHALKEEERACYLSDRKHCCKEEKTSEDKQSKPFADKY